MKKIDTKKIVFVISLVLITGFSTYALANRGFGSHMGGNNGNGYSGYHMGSGNGYGMGANQHMYNGNHMYDSVHQFVIRWDQLHHDWRFLPSYGRASPDCRRAAAKSAKRADETRAITRRANFPWRTS